MCILYSLIAVNGITNICIVVGASKDGLSLSHKSIHYLPMYFLGCCTDYYYVLKYVHCLPSTTLCCNDFCVETQCKIL